MGVFDQGYTRLKVLVILFGLLFFIGTCEAVFFGSDSPSVYSEFEERQRIEEAKNEEYDLIDALRDAPCPEGIYGIGCRIARFFAGASDVLGAIKDGIASFFTTLYRAITFTLSDDIPTWMTMIFAPIMITMTMIVIYIIADIIYDLIKALPTT